MASDGAVRSVSHNTFGDYAQIIQGDYNAPVHPPKKALELDYLHEATFNATNKQHAPGCLENTRVQVLSQIRSWIDDDGEKRIYWLRGMAGTGKTTISMTIAREYYKKRRLGASFFFSRSSGDLSSTTKFVATIANELAESLPAYREHLQNGLESYPSITSRSLYDQWEKLILDPLRSMSLDDGFQPMLIVIDALDECGSEYDQGVLIQCLAGLSALKKIPFRIFITSRPEGTIHIGFDRITSYSRQDFTLHDIEESIVAADLRLYYRHQLTGMDIDQSLITEETIDILARKSNRLFIHAATVCRFIRQGEIYAAKRLERFLASQDSQLEPERELDSIYTTILENAFAKFATLRPGEMETLQLSYQKVVGSVVIIYDKMSLTDFATMVDVPQEASGQIYVLHASFRDFLSDPQKSSSLRFSIDHRKIHTNLLQRCLEIMAMELQKNICRLREPGKRTKDIPASDVDSHVSQALQHQTKNRSIIEAAPLQLYISALIFSPRTSLIRRIYQHHIPSWVLSIPSLSESWNPQLRRLYYRDLAEVVAYSLDGHSGEVISISFSPNSSLLVSASDDKTIRFWNVITGTELLGSIYLWDIIDNKEVWVSCRTGDDSSKGDRDLTISPDGKSIACNGKHKKNVWLLDTENGKPLDNAKCFDTGVRSVAFSPDSKLLAAAVFKNIEIWNVATGATRRISTKGIVDAVLFSPDEKTIAVAISGVIQILNTFAFSVDGSEIASVSEKNAVTIWDTRFRTKHVDSEFSFEYPSIVAASRDDKQLASASYSDAIRLWDGQTGAKRELYIQRLRPLVDMFSNSHWLKKFVSRYKKPAYPGIYYTGRKKINISSIIFSMDGNFCACVWKTKRLQVWDVQSGRMLFARKLNSSTSENAVFSPDKSIAFSPNGNKLLAHRFSDRVVVINVETRQFVHAFTSNLHELKDLSIFDDNRYLGALDFMGRVFIWDLVTGSVVYEGFIRPNVSSLWFCLNGKHIFFTG
ncbi:WD domain, g-beta repeat domain-containing protein [Trichoderma breve]|uniref:WD domain, g-beta repeat domain-containing protein n=1 Tax=Trichoderma breve TaxID=2034170 RepID=A0A9W9EFC3_9HYPO|nr:WD domain, g-beta repeat domain-containing protein [Trichoderma breve]KAJ4865536.1 WD domain, g-beta repeat domain-containing protein [Trichoderma breve]